MELRDAVLPILPSGRVAFELCPDCGIPCSVVAVDPNTTAYQLEGRVYLAGDGMALPLSEAYRIEEVLYYLKVARNIQSEIDFQNSFAQ